MTDLPLLRDAEPSAPFAQRRGRTITVQAFLQDVWALADRLPDAARIANLCQDRTAFAVGFAAALVRGMVTLLPPSEAAGQLASVLGGISDVFCLTDGDHAVPTPVFRYPGDLRGERCDMPMIPSAQVAAVLYTSGSTGQPQPHPRSWGLLVSAARSAGAAIGADRLAGAALIGTVPHQHSYGLESLIMLALQHRLVLHAERPFYPGDIHARLEQAGTPRILVTTPVHLRVLLAERAWPPVDLVLSATAPLPPTLAADAEAAFAAPLHEIYGCSEIGQLAARRTTQGDEWRCLDGFSLRQDGAGTYASADGIETRLGDIIELTDSQRFRLLGRSGDLVNIAGKRSSLAFLNAQLAAIDGVRDAAFVMADDQSGGPARLVAFVVAPGCSRTAILAELRLRLDPAFLPRRLHLVATLPRNALGKLTQESVMALLGEAGTPGRLST